jgi:hypothetical protein
MIKLIRSLAVCSAVATLITTSAFAAPLRNERVQQSAPVYTPDNPRDAAVHDCSVEASKWSFSSWQSTQIITYDDCMASHNQPP